MRPARSSAAERTWLLKSARIRRVVATPTMAANPMRITSVRTADPPASRQRIGRRLYAEDVARAADRMEEPRLATGFELPSQVRDEHLDRVGDRERVVTPHLVQQPLARHDDALIAHEVLEQLELALGQLDGSIRADDLMGVGVEPQVADDQRRGAPRRPAAQQRAQPGEQLLAFERLDDVVVGARVQALDPLLEPVAGGEHEDADVVLALAQLLGDLDAVELGQPEIQQDHVGQEGMRLIQRIHAVAREAHVVALHPQRTLERERDLVVVLDHEHARGARKVVHGIDGRPNRTIQRGVLVRLYAGRVARAGVEGRWSPMPKRRKAQRTRARKPASNAAPRRPPRRYGAGLWLRLPVFDQRQLDLVGLALVALGVFLAFVLYGDWNGGKVGGALADGCRYLVGAIAYVVPAALVAGGLIVVLRPFLPSSRPFASGALCLFAALTLALAAGTFGLGPGGARTDAWSRAFIQPRGGVVGEGLYSAAAPAVQSLGAHVIALFLFAAALLLLTGATVAGVVHALRTGLVGTGRALRDSTTELSAALHRRGDEPGAAALPGEPLAPPEPAARDLVVKATHVEAPPLDAAARFPDLFGAAGVPPDGDAPTAEERLADDEEAGDEPDAHVGPDAADEEPEQPGVTRRDDAPAPAAQAAADARSRIADDPGFAW